MRDDFTREFGMPQFSYFTKSEERNPRIPININHQKKYSGPHTTTIPPEPQDNSRDVERFAPTPYPRVEPPPPPYIHTLKMFPVPMKTLIYNLLQ